MRNRLAEADKIIPSLTVLTGRDITLEEPQATGVVTFARATLPVTTWRESITYDVAMLLKDGPLIVDANLFEDANLEALPSTRRAAMFTLGHEAFEFLTVRIRHTLSGVWGTDDSLVMSGLIASNPAVAYGFWLSWISDALHRFEAHGLTLQDLDSLAEVTRRYWEGI